LLANAKSAVDKGRERVIIISLPLYHYHQNVPRKMSIQKGCNQLLTWTGASPKIADIGAIGRANKKRAFGLRQCQLSFESFGTITLDTTTRIIQKCLVIPSKSAHTSIWKYLGDTKLSLARLRLFDWGFQRAVERC
jgi:hypothetical protein